MKVIYLFACSLVLSGCGASQVVSEPKEPVEDAVASVEVPSSWELYENTRYGYMFSYPKEAIMFADIVNGDIIEPTSGDPRVSITDASQVLLTQGEANTLTIEVVDGQRSAHEWISQNLESYISGGDAGQTVKTFAGEMAIVLRGGGHLGSVEKLIVVEHNELIYILSYGSSSFTFEDILKTFAFTSS